MRSVDLRNNIFIKAPRDLLGSTAYELHAICQDQDLAWTPPARPLRVAPTRSTALSLSRLSKSGTCAPSLPLRHHQHLTMSSDRPAPQTLRNRRPQPFADGPPVPPKPSTELSLSQRRGLAPPQPPRQLKPLPPVPQLQLIESKPLPRPPDKLKLGTTALWIAAFAAWFLLIVVMMPIIMEREAMIGVNVWLRGWW
jgi:hypothetical protein